MQEITNAGGAREGAGRQAIPIDLAALEGLCVLQCTDEEIAAFLRVSLRTLQNRRQQRKFDDVMRRGKARGHINVRRAQMRLLDAGNAQMSIWLGKILLAQRDTMQITGANGGPIQTESKADFSWLSEDELRALRATLAKATGNGAL